MTAQQSVSLFASPKPKKRITVLVSLSTGRMAVKETDGGWRVIEWGK